MNIYVCFHKYIHRYSPNRSSITMMILTVVLFFTSAYLLPQRTNAKITGESWVQPVISNTPSVVYSGGSLVGSGDGEYLYAFGGNLSKNFWRYSTNNDIWTSMTNVPENIGNGGSLIYFNNGADDYIYANRGDGRGDFWRYSINNNTWANLASIPGTIGDGGTLAYPGSGEYIYATRGDSTKQFLRYNINTNTWTSLPNTPQDIYRGGSLVFPENGNYIFALRGEDTKEFWRYSTVEESWTSMSNIPSSVYFGGELIYPNTGDYIYAFSGYGRTDYLRYSISNNTWERMKESPFGISIGSALAYSGVGDYIYSLGGNNTTDFFRYSISQNKWEHTLRTTRNVSSGGSSLSMKNTDDIYFFTNGTSFTKYNIVNDSWTQLRDTPQSIGDGASLAYPGSGNYIYALRGGNNYNFWRYSISGNTWESMSSTLGWIGFGGSLVSSGNEDYLYALRGYNTRTFHRYNISGNNWEVMANTPQNVGSGGSLVYYPGNQESIFAFGGNNTNNFWRYNIQGNNWTTMTSTPQAVGSGGYLVYPEGSSYIYALRGSSTNRFWRYDIANAIWEELSNTPYLVGVGGSLAYNADTNTVYALFGNSSPYFSKYPLNNLYQIKSNSGISINNTHNRNINLESNFGLNSSESSEVTLALSNGSRVARINLNLTEDVDWSLLVAESNIANGKSLLYYPGGASDIPGIEGTSYDLFIPKLVDSESVLICPNVNTLSNVNRECINGYVFSEGETHRMAFPSGSGDVSVSIETINNQEYWVASGVMGTGGLSLSGEFNLKDNMSRLQVSERSDHTIEFGTIAGILEPAHSISLSFDLPTKNFSLLNISVNDIDLEDDGTDLVLCSSTGYSCIPTDTSWGVNINIISDTITFTHPTDANNGDIANGSSITIKIGTTADSGIGQIQNPTNLSEYEIAFEIINGDGSDHEVGEVSIPIVDDDTVNISGYLDTTLSFDIDTTTETGNTLGTGDCDTSGINACSSYKGSIDHLGYVVSVGEMNSNTVNRSNLTLARHNDGNTGLINSIFFDLETNAQGGAVVTVVSRFGGMFLDPSNIISSSESNPSSEIEISEGSGKYGIQSILGTHYRVSNTGMINVVDNCDGILNGGGGITGDYYCGISNHIATEIFNSGSNPIEEARVEFAIGVAPTSTNATGIYVDYLTFIATGTF